MISLEELEYWLLMIFKSFVYIVIYTEIFIDEIIKHLEIAFK